METLLTPRSTLAFLIVLTLWRLYLSATLQLHPDEAYYWLWSRHLDLGYFDHSPLVAYCIWLTTRLSNAEIWVRLSGILVSLLSSGLVWKLSLELFSSRRVAAASVLLFNAFPLTTFGLMVITPDVPVFMFWALSVYFFWQLIRSEQAGWWYGLGLSFGFALLSKYTAVLLLPCVFLYLVLTRHRRWLTTPHPYLALALGLSCFLPVIYWNSQHGWVSFLFQWQHGLHSPDFSAARVAEYLAGQLLIVGPLAWLAGMYAIAQGAFRPKLEPLLLPLLVSAIPVLFFALSSLKKVAGANWPMFAYFSFSIVVSHYLLTQPSKWRRALWAGSFMVSLLLMLVMTLHARFGVLPLSKYSEDLARADATNWFYGWRELGRELQRYPQTGFAVTPSHQLSAAIFYYTQGQLPVFTAPYARPSAFNYWRPSSEIDRREGIYIWVDGDLPGPYADYFSSPRQPQLLTVYRDLGRVRSYQIISGPPRAANAQAVMDLAEASASVPRQQNGDPGVAILLLD